MNVAAAIVAASVGAGAALSGCGGSPGSGTAPTSAARARSTTTVSIAAGAGVGCDTTAVASARTLTLNIGGRRRTVIVRVPTGYHPPTPVPLVLDLHGSESTALAQQLFSAMDATADAHTFIVAYPQAAIGANTGFDWNVPNEPLLNGEPTPAGAPDDVSFLEQLVPALAARYCIDPQRVYATGFSGGARMASQLACDASLTFAAVAPVSGLRFPTPCDAARAVPVVAFHGTADPVDPYNGNGQAYWTYSVPTAARRWAAHNGCAPTPSAGRIAPTVLVTTYSGCRGGAEVVLYTLVGEGHEWPGGPRLPRVLTRALGPQSTAVDADAVIWAFFAAHPLP